MPGGITARRKTRLVRFVRERPLASYYVLTFVLSWGYWVPLALAGGDGSHFPGLMGPMVAGMVVTLIVSGAGGGRDLVARMVRWRVPAPISVIVFAPLAVSFAALAFLMLLGSPFPTARQLGTLPGVPDIGWGAVFLVVLLINGYGEEVGWRGVAWPLLRRRHSLVRAALLLTIPWALWHLPTFWLDTGMRDLAPFVVPGWLVGLAAGSLVLGWLYEHSRHSLLVVAVFHASLNMASATGATAGLPAAVTTVAVIAAAVAILRRSSADRRVVRAPARRP